MFCEQCGSPVLDDAQFCTQCGTSVFRGSSVPESQWEASAPFGHGSMSPDQPPLSAAQALGGAGVAPAATFTPTFATAPQKSKNPYLPVIVISALVIVVALVALVIFFLAPLRAPSASSANQGGSNTPAVATTSGTDANAGKNNAGDSAGAASSGSGSNSGSNSGTTPANPSPSTSPEKQEPAAEVASGFIFADSNQRYLRESEIRALSDWERYIARNEIFARHGRGFRTQNLRDYFATQSWYTERYSPSDFDAMSSPLNDYERKNSELILSVEKSLGSPYAS